MSETIRFSENNEVGIINKDWEEAIREGKNADIYIFSQLREIDMSKIFFIVNETKTTDLFWSDSSYESALV